MNKSVLILAGDAVEALEIYYPYFRLLEAGVEVTIASPKGQQLHTVVHDFVGWETYTEKPGYLIDPHKSFSEIEPSRFDGLIIPGGRAPEYIRLDPNVPDIVRHFLENDKPVGALCHGAQVLETVPDLMEGRSLTAYIACKPGVELMNARYEEASTHTDQNLVSAHAWPDLPGFMKAFLERL